MIDKIICVGKNYPAHAAELGEAQPEQPVLFLKPSSCLLQLSDDFTTPPLSLKLPEGEIHHELEVVFQISGLGSQSWFSAFTLGLDLTRRDLQTRLKKNGHPWEIAKVFKDSAILGPWQTAARWPQFRDESFELLINNEVRQSGEVSEMLWTPEHCLELAGRYFPVLPGDLIYTGTPAGVGPLRQGDLLQMRWGSQLMGPKIQIA